MKPQLKHEHTQKFKKGQAYNLADGDLNLPKELYTEYFENSDDVEGEWMAEDICKKSFTVVTHVYEP